MGRVRSGLRDTWAEVDGRAMFARVSASPRAGVPMVLVHGLGVSGRYLIPTALRLARDFPVFVPDLPGFGRSVKPPRPLTVPGMADALAAWMRRAGLRDACLVGNSLGCQTIVDLAIRHPELVGWAVLVGPTVDPAARTLAALTARGLLDLIGEPVTYWPLVAWDYLAAGPRRTLATLRHALADPVADKLTRVQAPTLVVRGGLDPIAPQRWVEEMAGRLPRGRLLVIPGTAHVPNFTAPDALARATRDWVAAQPPGPRPPPPDFRGDPGG